MLRRRLTSFLRATGVLALPSTLLGQQLAPNRVNVPVHLVVEAGTPLRLYITKRVSYRQNSAVEAKLAEPVWAFDRIVIPAGTPVEGKVAQVNPVPKTQRAIAMVRGDFTPLKLAKVSFSRAVLPSGQAITLDTQPSAGLASIYVPPKPPKNNKKAVAAPSSSTKVAKFRSVAKQQAQAQWNATTQGVVDVVRGQNRREWFEDFLWTKLPYHPQWYRARTRFDAVLEKAIDFGEVNTPQATFAQLGRQPAADQTASVRLVSALSSSDARVGDPVKGVLSQPLFSVDHKLILPEGTEVNGKVTMARHARMFHRGGQLRFTFEQVEVPELAGATVPDTQKVQAQLTKAELDAGPVAVDEEGTAKATESKTRFLRPAIAGLVAARTLDDDAGKQGTAGHANYSGRGVGGFSGFGLFGTAAAWGPRFVGSALGFYGLAWSAYTNIVARGREVTFEKNTATAIRFGAQQAHPK
jgi:hypothetical protein